MLVLRKLYVELGSNFIHIWLTIVSFYLAKAAKLFTCCFHVGVNLFKNLIIHRAVLTCSLTLNNDFTLWSISFVRLLLSKLFGIFILHLIARFSLKLWNKPFSDFDKRGTCTVGLNWGGLQLLKDYCSESSKKINFGFFSLGLRERINVSRATKNYPGT